MIFCSLGFCMFVFVSLVFETGLFGNITLLYGLAVTKVLVFLVLDLISSFVVLVSCRLLSRATRLIACLISDLCDFSLG